MRKLLIFVLCAALLCPILAIAAESEPALTLLFTTDIHSHDIPHTALIDGKAALAGGYARLKSAVDANRAEGRTLLLDSGDYSMATLYQTFTVSDALDLRLMQMVGYDAVALGNHDFEVTESGLKEELTRFYESGGSFPLLCGNLSESGANPLAAYGVKDYALFEVNGLRVGVFALMGKEAADYTPVTELKFADPVKAAKRIVGILRETEKADVIILLAHAGTMPDGSFHEDADIAKAVPGIDVILSGHMHVPMEEAQIVNDTVLACAGTALNHLGKLDLYKDGDKWRADYSLIPLTEEWPEDAQIKALLDPYEKKLDSEYFSVYGADVAQSDPVAVSPYNFADGDTMCLKLDNYAFGELITDGYLSTLRQLNVNAQAAALPVGSVRGGLYEGALRMDDLYNALSYGVSPIDGSCASPIVTAYLTGRELYDLCETSVSLSAIMNSAQLLLGGIRCTYADARPLLNKVIAVEIYDDGADAWEKVARSEDRLYSFACSWQSLQSINLIRSKSYGLLSIVPKDENGKELNSDDELMTRIVRLPSGAELKEWDTLYRYLGTMEKNDDGLPVISARYGEQADYLRKADSSFLGFFASPNKAALIQYAVVLFILLLIALSILLAKRRKTKKGGKAK